MSKIFASNNLSVGGSGVKWNIKASTEAPTSETEGHLGDVIVTSADIKKLKYVATKKAGEELQDNSINVYEDFTQPKILVNQNNGFNMYIFSSSQNIMLDGNLVIANVYFYDGLTNEWVQYPSAYVDAINLDIFTGQSLVNILDSVWVGSNFVDNVDAYIPPMQKVTSSDIVTTESFSGIDLDIDSVYVNLVFTETGTLRTSDFNEGEDVEF